MKKEIENTETTKFFEVASKLSGFNNLPKEAQEFFSNILDFKSVTFPIEITDQLLGRKLLESTQFFDVLKYFDNATFEMKYQSDNFVPYFTELSKLYSRKLTNLSIVIHSSEFRQADINFLNMEKTPFSVKIPPVNFIYKYAFNECHYLTHVTIPSSVTSIGSHAFAHCKKIEQLTIPSSVTSIFEWAFSDCRSLKRLDLPSTLIVVSQYAFSGCTGLKQIIIPSSLTHLSNELFSFCTAFTKITIPPSITKIGDGTFSHCSSLIEISIPSSVISIGDNAFDGCYDLPRITIPSSVKKIGKNAFHDCFKLVEISIPSSLKNPFFRNHVGLKKTTKVKKY